ncbi:MAG: LysR family transcriptional regulator [Myxococcota bacterium]
MRLFVALAETGSLTAAGRALGVPKQTVSRRLAALEEALGAALTHRTTRQVRLTEAGRAYAERSAEVVRLAREADDAVASATPSGTLRVTCTEALGEAFLAPVVADYLTRWPDVRVEVVLAERRVDLVAEGLDVAVRVGSLDDSSLVARRLGPARVAVCASPAYLARRGSPASPADLAGHDCIVNAAEARLARWPLGGGVVQVSGRVAANHVGFMLASCRAGLGIALLPRFLVAEDLARGTLVAVMDEVEVGSVWLVTPGRRLVAARVRAFLDLASEAWKGRF